MSRGSIYVDRFFLPSGASEAAFLQMQRRTCYSGVYPYKLFPEKGLEEIELAPITIFCGGNGSGKSTLLNVIAQKTGVIRHSAFSGSAFFGQYVDSCELQGREIPGHSQILTSDDVSDYLLNIRYLNDGIDVRREELFEDFLTRKYAKHRFTGMADYDNWKESADAKSKTQSQYVRERLMRNVEMFSNGESALRYFTEHITQDALYLLDEPENSLSVQLQEELARFLADSAGYFGCQILLSTHSPILLALKNAVIYDLDERPVATRRWSELENVRQYFTFFEKHRDEFLP